ncbi:hypothetical protein [Kribbella italica]|uniref:Excreted virulence factor EspC (Type VII ESX diderm) n=1 Tax=Kribbella italica TaxID=1540520 RepID=A0A7W9JDE9_9ACTN|nr:hypothetical protein [Kribbella italica]MBB5840101.1 hypothetical protein [Kribbella italica]
MSEDRIHVKDTAAFNRFTTGMDATAQAFGTSVAEAGVRSTYEAPAGGMAEGVAFLGKERQARDQLAQFMTKTMDGMVGYRKAVGAIGEQYDGTINRQVGIMNPLLEANNQPVPNNPAFGPSGV